MTSWTVDQLLHATRGELVTGKRSTPVKGVSLDSRRLKPQEAFLAIRGPRFDAHRFIPEAIERGAACLIVSQALHPIPAIATILVSDTVQALGDIAAFHRARFRIPVIAVTGSCGKTTTKELIAHLFEPDHHVLKTNLTENNRIGLPLTLLRLSPAHDVAVVELGSNHPGEIAYLAQMAHPTVAVITNVGPTHLEFFESLEEVRREKLSVLEALEPTGAAILPGDQLEVLLQAKSRLTPQTTLLTFGTSEQCGVQACELSRQEHGMAMRVRGVAGTFFVPLPGSHNVENALAALACVHALGIPLESLHARLASFTSLPLRSEVLRANGITIINDCYNANPLAFARALEVLRDCDVKRRVVIAGDMLELGAVSQAAHQAIGRLCAQLGMDLIVGVGSFAAEVAQGAAEVDHTRTLTCRTVEELQRLLPSIVQEGDGLLIKGSRKLRLERVAESLLDVATTTTRG